MNQLPTFLKIAKEPNASWGGELNADGNPYQPLLGLWLIDMALSGNWIDKPPSGSLSTTFCDMDYLSVTGLKGVTQLFPDHLDDEADLSFLTGASDVEDEDIAVKVPKAHSKAKPKRLKPSVIKQELRALLLKRRATLVKKAVDEKQPLFQNLYRLKRMLHLSDAELAVLTFAACLSCFTTFRRSLVLNNLRVTDSQFAQMLSKLTGHPEVDLRKAMHRSSVLMNAGLVRIEHDEEDLEDKIKLSRGLREVILDQLSSDEELSSRMLSLATPAELTLAAFPHLQADIELMRAYLQGVMRDQVCGSNILLYGPPGCGKTELAKALMQSVGITLYEIAYADSDGDPIQGAQRLHSFNFCQQALKGKTQVALMFDEMEDVLSGGAQDDLPAFLRSPKSAGSDGGHKAWMNRTLESNPIPTIWITNDADIDEAYLRRFDYSVALRVPPRKVRHGIAANYLAPFNPSEDQLSALASLDDLLPSQLQRAARVAQLTHGPGSPQAWSHVEQTLQRSRELLGQPRVCLKPRIQTAYSLDFIRADANIAEILDGLKAAPEATFCLYGPPGTGKSLLAQHVAKELGMPVLLKRASDLLDKYVGETEQRIAAMFAQARDEGAVLVLDEADSFLCDRMGAQRQWEVTQTNEFLTQLEQFEGIFFATTNLIDKLDAAVLRRFSHKIKFDYLTPAQGWALFQQEAGRLGMDNAEMATEREAVQRLAGLTPGDFAAVLKRLGTLKGTPSAASLRAGLEGEVKVKRHGKGPIGFV